MKLIILVLSILMTTVSNGQAFLLNQPKMGDVVNYEGINDGVKTKIVTPFILNSFKYPYINLYKINEPIVFTTSIYEYGLTLIKNYYKTPEDSIIRYFNYRWDVFPPNTDSKEKLKIIKKSKIEFQDYISLFDSLKAGISKQLAEIPSEDIGLDTIYNKDGSVYYYYKSAYWNTPNRYINLFFTYTDDVRNVSLSTYWASNSDINWLREERGDKIYKTVELETIPTFNFSGNNVYQYITNYFTPKTKITKKNVGKIGISIIISDTGEVTEVRILKGIDPSYDGEIKEFLLSMPKWVPGRKKDKNVYCEYTILVNVDK